ncbi:MAG: PQQ-binding-like beta-propeller repeat protein [Thermoanaerobaculales bacterium]|nr:PQQ-binding-like beta-propeller repeat protein [Thermoanaerobaculales bacterium]
MKPIQCNAAVLSISFLIGLAVCGAVCGAANDPLVTAVSGKLKASDPGVGDSFTAAVAIDGDTIVVGAPEDDDAGSNAGAAYVYHRNEGGLDAWAEVAKLSGTDTDQDDLFGSSVAISGDTIVVGAPGAGSPTGAAYVFQKNQGGEDAWGQVARIVGADTDAGDEFGAAVSIDKGLVAVGAPQDSDMYSSAGSAYVFARNQGGAESWGEVTKLVASGASVNDLFGGSVAISGATVVAGAAADDGGAVSGGAAYVFARNLGGVDAWSEAAVLTPSDPTDGKGFADSVAIWVDTVIVGAPNDDDVQPGGGAVYFFERNHGAGPDTWAQVVKVSASGITAGAGLGTSVAISGEYAVAGAPDFDSGANTAQGQMLILRRNFSGADSWGIADAVDSPDAGVDLFFGGSVAISCGTVVAGAAGDDDGATDSGAAHVLEHAGDQWEVRVRVQSDDIENYDVFGAAVAMSGDTMVVGRPLDDDLGTDSGSAYIFTRNEGGSDQWQQIAKLLPSDPGQYAFFGYALDIDGDTVVVSSYSNNNGMGDAYVFERNQGGTDNWGEVQRIEASDGYALEQFGKSVSMSGDTIIIGAPRVHDIYTGEGAAYVFERNLGGADNWGERIKISNPEPYLYDYFGNAVDLDEDTAIVGKSADGLDNRGSAYIFARNRDGADAWGLVAKLSNTASSPADDRCGISVAIEGDTAVSGCTGTSPDGAVHVFERNSGGIDSWGRVALLTALDSQSDQWFGNAVEIACGTLVVGDYGDSHAGDQSGSAYVYRRNLGGADAWGGLAKLIDTAPAAGDLFGKDVAVTCEHIAVGVKNYGQDAGSVVVHDLHASQVDLGISIDNHSSMSVPGTTTTYEVVVSNTGPDTAYGALVMDVLDPALFDVSASSWACTAGSGLWTACPAGGTGEEIAAGVSVSVEPGDSVTFSIDAAITRQATGSLANTVTVRPPWAAVDTLTGDNSATDTDGLLQLDLGDAPDPSYPTLHASNGAAHGIVAAIHLGASVDAELDGQPSTGADGDDGDGSDDEDGVSYPAPLLVGQQATIVVEASVSGVLDAWLDINADGDWDDASEQVFTSRSIGAGSNVLFFSIDATAAPGSTMMRFRFSSTGGLLPLGVASNGEVEDYEAFLLEAPIDSLQAFSATAGDGQNTLYWRTPTVDYHSTIVVGRASIPPTGPTDPDATVVFDGVQSPNQNYSVAHSGLTNGTTWYYAGYAKTSGGAASGPRRVSARPQSASGPVAWSYSTSAASLAPPAILPGTTYFAVSNDRQVHAMTWDSGGSPTTWATPTMNGPAQGRLPVLDLPTTTIGGASTVMFAGSQDGTVYAFDAVTGAQLWRTGLLGGVDTMVQAAPSVMFVDFGAPFNLAVAATWDVGGSAVHGIDVQSGDVEWTFDDGGAGIGVISTQPLLDTASNPPRAYIASRARASGSSTIWCLEIAADSASELWSVSLGDIDAAPALWNGRLYVGTLSGKIYALDPDTGAALWSSPWSTNDGAIKDYVWPDFVSGRLFFSTANGVQAIDDAVTSAQGFWAPGSWVERPKLLADDGVASDYFGGTNHSGVAIDGDTAIIGAYNNDDQGSASGSAYIFERSNDGSGQWSQEKKILQSSGASTDRFGLSVSVSGDTAVVGAYGHDAAASGAGAAYVFQKDHGAPDEWGEVKKLLAGDAQASDFFGYSVAVDGDIAVVGAYGEDGPGFSSGAAYIFSRNEGDPDNWGEVAKIVADDGAGSDYFGWAVAVSGTTAVVGAKGHDTQGLSSAGAAYVFERDGSGDWLQVKKLTASDPSADDAFGEAVAIDNDIIVIGASGWDSPFVGSIVNIGQVYVFERNSGGPDNWAQTASFANGWAAGNDRFGYALGLSGSQLVVGAYGHDWPASGSGAVFVFRRSAISGTWTTLARVSPSGAESNDAVGRSCAISGSTVLAGAYGDDDMGLSAGAAYIFDQTGPSGISSPSAPIVIGTNVFFGSDDGRLYQFDRTQETGLLKWVDLGDPEVPKTIGSPGYDVTQSRVLVGSDQGRIYSVEVPLP